MFMRFLGDGIGHRTNRPNSNRSSSLEPPTDDDEMDPQDATPIVVEDGTAPGNDEDEDEDEDPEDEEDNEEQHQEEEDYGYGDQDDLEGSDEENYEERDNNLGLEDGEDFYADEYGDGGYAPL
jgi:hypothetical protein